MILHPDTNHAPAQVATLGFIPDGPAGIRATLKQMAAWVRQYKTRPDIRAFAESIIAMIPAKQYSREVRAVYDWVKTNIRYTQDVRDVETLKTPDAVIYSGMGDCDDMSLLVATLLESIGYATAFVAVGFSAPNEYEHVYTEVKLGNVWIPLETTEDVAMGWKPQNPAALMRWHV